MRGLKFAFGLVLAIPGVLFVAFWATVFLVPLWRWIERDYGIEIMGHSGPAEWCFYLVFAILMVPTIYIIWRIWRGGRPVS